MRAIYNTKWCGVNFRTFLLQIKWKGNARHRKQTLPTGYR